MGSVGLEHHLTAIKNMCQIYTHISQPDIEQLKKGKC